jgi:hypothetical protein
MGQLGFFDADNRLTALSAKGDPLEAIDRLVPWESFRGDIVANLHPTRGNVFYMNLRSRKAFKRNRATRYHWKEVT